MKINLSIVLLVALCCAQVIAADSSTDTNATSPDTSDTTTTTEVPDPTPTSTNTVAPETNATTTVTPETTTSKPTTTTTSSTTASTTTTAAPPTPKPKPEVEFPKNTATWTYTNATNFTCIKIRGAFRLYFPFKAGVNGTEIKNGTIDVEPDASSTGSCGEKSQSITLSWAPVGITEVENNTLTFKFAAHDGNSSKITDGKFALHHIEYTVHLDNQEKFSNASDKKLTFEIHTLDKDQVEVSRSYRCIAVGTITNPTDGAQELKVANLQYEAFHNSTTDDKFAAYDECNLDGVTDIVPIAVGASLAGLVVIVLIAYLIGRRRSRARGYQSV